MSIVAAKIILAIPFIFIGFINVAVIIFTLYDRDDDDRWRR